MTNFLKLTNSTSDKSFKDGVTLGFIISIGIFFLINKLEGNYYEILSSIIFGIVFTGIIFNVSIMFFTNSFISLIFIVFKLRHNELIKNIEREQWFELVVKCHLPQILGLIGLLKYFSFDIPVRTVFISLEMISITILISQIIKLKSRQSVVTNK